MQEIIIIIITTKASLDTKMTMATGRDRVGDETTHDLFLPKMKRGGQSHQILQLKQQRVVIIERLFVFCFILLYFSNSESFLFVDRQIQDQTLPDRSTQKSQKRLTLQAVYVADETRRDERRRDEGQGGGKWKRWGKSQKKKRKKSGKGRAT